MFPGLRASVGHPDQAPWRARGGASSAAPDIDHSNREGRNETGDGNPGMSAIRSPTSPYRTCSKGQLSALEPYDLYRFANIESGFPAGELSGTVRSATVGLTPVQLLIERTASSTRRPSNPLNYLQTYQHTHLPTYKPTDKQTYKQCDFEANILTCAESLESSFPRTHEQTHITPDIENTGENDAKTNIY